jgi:D-beta-D-heptose 7-phosphate kinase / D-beta-D-heptose 1-phosphate adenosyltransferase
MNKRILVTCNGCFDGLHPGHMFFLGFCRGQGDRLIVGINADHYILTHKRPNPIPVEERKQVLMDLGIVESVDVFTENNPIEFIKRTEPHIHCISEEYRDTAVELDMCIKRGIIVVYVPRIGKWSSTMMRGGY